MFTTFTSICNQMEVMIKLLRLCHLLVKPCSLSFAPASWRPVLLSTEEHKLSDLLVSVLIAYDRGHNIPSKIQMCTQMATMQVSCLWNKEDPNQRVKRDKNTHSPTHCTILYERRLKGTLWLTFLGRFWRSNESYQVLTGWVYDSPESYPGGGNTGTITQFD